METIDGGYVPAFGKASMRDRTETWGIPQANGRDDERESLSIAFWACPPVRSRTNTKLCLQNQWKMVPLSTIPERLLRRTTWSVVFTTTGMSRRTNKDTLPCPVPRKNHPSRQTKQSLPHSHAWSQAEMHLENLSYPGIPGVKKLLHTTEHYPKMKDLGLSGNYPRQ